MAEHEYDLLLRPDYRTTRHMQWFYFKITGGIKPKTPYRFTILNFCKVVYRCMSTSYTHSCRPPTPIYSHPIPMDVTLTPTLIG